MKRTALVTGASRGIGFAIANALALHVENLIVVAKHKENLAKAVAKLKGPKIFSFVCDLEKESEIKSLEEKINKQFRSLDILINNAGVYIGKRFANTPVSEINLMLNLNLRAYILLTKGLMPLLEKGIHSQIINISSCAVHAEIFGETIYSATKAAVTAFDNVLRKEVNKNNIRVTSIQPWGVDTYPVPQPESLLNPQEIGKVVGFIINTNPLTQIDTIELSHIRQWRGNKPPWIE